MEPKKEGSWGEFVPFPHLVDCMINTSARHCLRGKLKSYTFEVRRKSWKARTKPARLRAICVLEQEAIRLYTQGAHDLLHPPVATNFVKKKQGKEIPSYEALATIVHTRIMQCMHVLGMSRSIFC
jgi:hypothetical protein